jgi:hypothetical protein
MKASALKVRSASNIDSHDDIEMSFDVKGQVKMAAILINLYSDLWSAIIREYAANGYDSHVSAGQKRPIEITLPTTYDPIFRVKDYGVGMSLRDIREIYSKYGASTKDLDNDQIGSYGLGCKSALSVSPSFTVTAIKNGVKTVVIVSREEKSLGRIKPVMQVDTDEANGVEISIAVDASPSEFAEKATQVFFTWPKGSVLIDGKAPTKSIYEESDFLHLGNGAYMSHERTSGFYGDDTKKGLMINMGGIGYPVVESQYRLLLDTAQRRGSVSQGSIGQHKLIITVPLGSVDLVPSREGIRWSQKSTDTVVEKLKETMGLVVSSIQQKIDTIENMAGLFSKDIFTLGSSFPDYFMQGDLTWKGEKFPRGKHFENVPKNLKVTSNCGSTYHNLRIARSYHGPEFEFGFGASNSCLEIGSSDKSSRHNWIFIDCRNQDATPADLHHHVKSLIKARDFPGGAVSAMYIFDDFLDSNKWIQTMISIPNSNIFSMKAEALIEESLAYRKEKARLNRLTAKKVENPYTVSITIGEEGKKRRVDTTMTASEIEQKLVENPDLLVFADEVIFSTANKEYSNSAMFFLPDNIIVVYMRGARKASTFVNKVNFPVRVDLAGFLAECMVGEIEQVEFREYFYELHLSYDLCSFGSRLKLPEGFLKDCFGKAERYSKTRNLMNNMNEVKKIEGAIFPEISYVIKSRKISELGALFFEDPQPWGMSSRSAAYKKQMEIYLTGISDKIDKIVNS